MVSKQHWSAIKLFLDLADFSLLWDSEKYLVRISMSCTRETQIERAHDALCAMGTMW